MKNEKPSIDLKNIDGNKYHLLKTIEKNFLDKVKKNMDKNN